MRKTLSLGERFERHFTRGANADCWLWSGCTKSKGHGASLYGHIRLSGHEGKWRNAHRVSYELYVGPIPDGLTVDHLCGNTLCVNPAHLEAVTIAENTRRARMNELRLRRDVPPWFVRLRNWLDERGLTVAAFLEMSEVTQGQLSYAIKSGRPAPAPIVRALRDVAGIDVAA